MIPVANIKAIINALSTAIGITIIRSDDQGTHPDFSYATYKVISSREESAHRNYIEVDESGTNNAAIIRHEISREVVSLNFIDKGKVADIYIVAGLALQWFKSITGREVCKTNSISVQIISPQIEDRTVYLDTFFENKIGFDVRFDYSGSVTETIEAIETVSITPTIDSVEQTIIIVEEA